MPQPDAQPGPESSPSPPPAAPEPTRDDIPVTPPPLPPAKAPEIASDDPPCLGRYRLAARLGAGGFGIVYKGRDDELRRDVAIKVPHRHRVATPEQIEAYLAEARILAGLDHPGIVPIFDVGRSDDGLCYIVSKFIAGSDLAARLKQGPLRVADAVELVARVALALHHAHQHGLVHRDVKPANLLLDTAGHPVVADFGLALRDEDYGKGSGFAGTPAYMSPEQARGEGHRVDARSDVYSLGVVFYELLTGRRPFLGDSLDALLEQIRVQEVRPPRQHDDTIPKELDRICLKALAKRAADRYSTALDLADDLRHWQTTASRERQRPEVVSQERQRPENAIPSPVADAPGSPSPVAAAPDSDRPRNIVPRGLRSFDAADGDFFLDLLPGPRDRDGLPEGLRFWKRRIEEAESFPVGVLYGPSGCGKSSLVKAGLLPRLAGHVTVVYVEATPDDTEARLLKGLRQRCPDLPPNHGLAAALAHLRRNLAASRSRVSGPAPAAKVLLVLDQFEQWLHAKRTEHDTDLLEALRHCDGQRVQCLFLVRDDFWMAATRFLRDLEIRLVEGDNAAAVDLFDPRHARTVLAAFGRAYGALPDGALMAEQEQFLDRAVAGLAQDGKVISVRLALFAEMVKAKPWTPATLKAIGGAEGVGVVFLEETFSAAAAPPAHRLHQQAARAVLKALLPEQGTDIKGTMRSRAELLAASGYPRRPDDFADLLRILDAELRLVTPTEGEPASGGRQPPVGAPQQGADAPRSPVDAQYYQLTHDYLVPALRQWLTRKQRETRRGRAELRLQERAALWTAKPENRHLPAGWEWLNIRLFTRRRDWTPPQQQLMRRAARHHGLRAVLLLAALLLAGWGAWEVHGTLKAAALVRALVAADTPNVPKIVDELGGYRRWADADLRQRAAAAAPDSREHLHLALALLPADPGQTDGLVERLRTATPDEVLVLRDALAPQRETVAAQLWPLLADAKADSGQRFRAACVLAAYEPDSPRWAAVRTEVLNYLVRENPLLVGKWTEVLRPVGPTLLPALSDVFRDGQRPESERSVATSLLADYAADRPELLYELVREADARGFAVLWPKLRLHRDRALARANTELDKTLAPAWPDAPLDAGWTTVPAAVIEQIEAAHGLVAERFALCQALPLEQFDAVAEGLRPCGYRPVNFRPYDAGGALRVAAVWTRDGKDYRLAHGLSADEVAKRDTTERKQGLMPLDVATYETGPGAKPVVVHAVLWAKPDAATVDAKLYVGVPEKAHRTIWQPWQKDGFVPRTVTTLEVDGQPRYSGIWWKSAPPREDRAYWDQDEEDYEGQLSPSRLQLDVRLGWAPRRLLQARREGVALWTAAPAQGLAGVPWAALVLGRQRQEAGPPGRDYGQVYRDSPEWVSAEVHGLEMRAHLERCRELARQGYRPAALAVSWPQAARLRAGQPAGEPPAATALVAASVWHRPAVPEASKEALAKRQAQAAVMLLQLGQAERVWPLLQHSPDPRLRTWIIHKLSPLGSDPHSLLQRLDAERDVSIRRALLLSLGEFTEAQLPAAERQPLLDRLLRTYRDEPDAGLHGAADWLLRRWGQGEAVTKIDRELISTRPLEQRQWYVTKEGHTLVTLPGPVTFWMGSPSGELERTPVNEPLHRRRIPRSFALATKEVTVTQFQRFLKAHPEVRHNYTKRYSPEQEGPIVGVTWYEAAQYCRWLSEEEGLPEEEMCYPPIAKFGENMVLPANYLSRTGYRLPTEAEWEYACRAGTATSRHYGAAEELLGQYAWYLGNSKDRAWPVGRLKPNDYGFFDLYGNAGEWCDSLPRFYPLAAGEKNIEDKESVFSVTERQGRVLRGASFDVSPADVRSALRVRDAPAGRSDTVGLRVARTYR